MELASPFIRYALRTAPLRVRNNAPPVYCEYIEILRDSGYPDYMPSPSECERRLVEASIDIEIDPTCAAEDLHDLLIMCDDMIAHQRSRHLTRAREVIVGAYKRKHQAHIALTPLDEMLKRVHRDEFIAYSREQARLQAVAARLSGK